MYTNVVNVQLRDSDVLRVVLAGDFHWGAANCQEDLITKRFVPKYAGRPFTRLIDMGDEFDLVWRRDLKRFEPRCVHPRYQNEPNMVGLMRADFLKEMAPLEGQFDGACDSNHNAAYRKHADFDLYDEFARAMGAPKLGYGGYVVYRIKHRTHRKVYSYDVPYAVCHGLGGGGFTIGGSINTVSRDGVKFQGGVIAHGHTHQLRTPGSRKWFEWDSETGKIIVRRQRIFQTGSFLYTYSQDEYDGYGARARYEPADTGWIVTEIHMDGLNGEPRMRAYAEEYE